MKITVLLGLGLILAGCTSSLVTLDSKGPQMAHKVLIVDYDTPLNIDRNFDLKVDGKVVFHSPDEGQPGTEKVIWSQDGNRFLLLGKNFLAQEGSELSDGNALYLMYDIPSATLWCNTKQRNEKPIPAEEIRRTQWSEKVPPLVKS